MVERVAYDAGIARLHSALAFAAGNPFLHPAWILTHARRLEPEADTRTWLVSDGTGPVGVAVLSHRADGSVRFAGDRLSDLTGPVCRPRDLERVLGAMAGGLEAIVPPAGRFRAGPLPVEVSGALPGWSGGVPEPSPKVVVLGSSWDGYLAGSDARRRRRILSQSGRLLAAPEVELTTSSTPEEVTCGIEILAELHTARFGGRSRTFTAERLGFFREALAEMASEGSVVVRTLWHKERPAASILVLRTGGDDWFYQSGWDPSLARLGVGRALFAHSVEQAFADERGAFRMLRGDEDYKRFWTTDVDLVATFERSRP